MGKKENQKEKKTMGLANSIRLTGGIREDFYGYRKVGDRHKAYSVAQMFPSLVFHGSAKA